MKRTYLYPTLTFESFTVENGIAVSDECNGIIIDDWTTEGGQTVNF